MPWWVATILWCVPMLAIGAAAVGLLYDGLRLAFGAVSDADLGRGLGALFLGYLGVLVSLWWFREAKHWREIAPKTLRPPSTSRRTSEATDTSY